VSVQLVSPLPLTLNGRAVAALEVVGSPWSTVPGPRRPPGHPAPRQPTPRHPTPGSPRCGLPPRLPCWRSCSSLACTSARLSWLGTGRRAPPISRHWPRPGRRSAGRPRRACGQRRSPPRRAARSSGAVWWDGPHWSRSGCRCRSRCPASRRQAGGRQRDRWPVSKLGSASGRWVPPGGPVRRGPWRRPTGAARSAIRRSDGALVVAAAPIGDGLWPAAPKRGLLEQVPAGPGQFRNRGVSLPRLRWGRSVVW